MIINVPGSKSFTNRALLAAACAGGGQIKKVLLANDTKAMLAALKNLGFAISRSKNTVRVKGRFSKPRTKIFCGNSGTTMRFLAAALAAQDFESVLDGGERMRQRPVNDLADALKQLGSSIEYLGREGYPPLKVKGPLLGGKCRVKGNISSQFLSGLLMAAPMAQKSTEIQVSGKLVSKPYIDMTLRVMKKFGISVKREGYKKFFIKSGHKYKPQTYLVEGDASSASYFWGLEALIGEKFTITNLPQNSLQADARLPEILEKYIKPRLEKNIRLTGEQKNKTCEKTVNINCADFPDSAMTLACLCAFVDGKTKLSGLANLRVKECDRLRGLAAELNKINCKTKELKNGLLICGNPKRLRGAEIETYNDHRMAMCFGMIGIVIPDIKIKNPLCVNKTYPDFWKDLGRIKKYLSRKNIVLTGMRGSGKTSLGRLLAKKLKRKFIDIDSHIEQKAGAKIAKIVADKGWKRFRMLEKRAVKDLAGVKNSVIAAGGGTLMNSANAKILKKNGRVIFLECGLGALKQRIAGNRNRPSLTGKSSFLDELATVYQKRKKRYYGSADAVIDVSRQTENSAKDLETKIKLLMEQTQRWGL